MDEPGGTKIWGRKKKKSLALTFFVEKNAFAGVGCDL